MVKREELPSILISSFSKWIKLNVGGKPFQTTLTTLTSCPDSLLAKMFDPESSLEPAYSEDGVYFIDADPKYFSIILNWLRYREVLVNSDIKLGNLAKVAHFFGLQELADRLKKVEHEEELKKADDELKKDGIRHADVMLLSDEGEAAEHVGDHMGLFLKEGDGKYRHVGGKEYLSIISKNVWFKRDNKGTFVLRNDNGSDNLFPWRGWAFYDKNTGQLTKDMQFNAVHLSEFKFCNSVTLSSTKYERSEFLGEFRRVPRDWLNGWPVFKNQEGNYLRVASGTSCWSVNSVRDKDVNQEDKLSSNRVTSCPAHARAGVIGRDGEYHWRYGRRERDETLRVTCDVHGSSSQ